MVQRPLLVERAGQHLVARPFFRRQTLAGQRAHVQGGPALHDDAVGRHAGARLDDDAVAGAQLGDEDALLPAVAQPPAAARADGDDRPHRPLGALEGEMFEAFAEQADEDDFLGDLWPAGEDSGDAGDGDGQVGADAALEKGVQGAVKDAGAAQDGGDEREAEAEAPGRHVVGPGRDPEPDVHADEDGDDGGEEVEEQPALGLEVVAGVRNLAVHGWRQTSRVA